MLLDKFGGHDVAVLIACICRTEYPVDFLVGFFCCFGQVEPRMPAYYVEGTELCCDLLIAADRYSVKLSGRVSVYPYAGEIYAFLP